MEYKERKVTQTSNPNTQEREYVQTEANYVPAAPEDRGVSGATVAMIVIGTVTAMALLFFLLIYNQRQDENLNRQTEAAQQQPQQPVVVQQPAQPIIVQQPPSQPAPIIVPDQSTSGSTIPSSSSSNTAAKDLAIQKEIDRRMKENTEFSKLDISASVVDGEVMLMGVVESADMKKRVERMVKEIKGVKKVDNQIVVTDSKM